MFTGIVQSLGSVLSTKQRGNAVRMVIDLGGLDISAIDIGDSIACNGVCLTVIELDQIQASFDVSAESLSKSLIGQWQAGDSVNLELALTLNTPLGGHLMAGHVDGLAELQNIEADDEGRRCHLWLQTELGRLIAPKGSICLNGVSLTTNQVISDQAPSLDNSTQGTLFNVTIVPHTLTATTFGTLSVGDQLHVEIDLIARYLARYLDRIRELDA